MGSEGGWKMPMPDSSIYPLSPPGTQFNSQNPLPYGLLAPPYSPPSTPYENTFPANYTHIPAPPYYLPPPPYYPPSDVNEPPPQQAFSTPFYHLPSQPPFAQQQYEHHNQNPSYQREEIPPTYASVPDYPPSCPPAVDDSSFKITDDSSFKITDDSSFKITDDSSFKITDDSSFRTTDDSHIQRGTISKVPSIGFEESGNPLYPSLPDEFHTNESNENHRQSEPYRPTPFPPNLILLWQGSKPVNIFFVQQEGHVVSPDRPLNFFVYKCPPGNAMNATVLLRAEDSWRLGLSKQRSYIMKGIQGELAFYDDSTSPARYVIVLLKEMSKEEKQRLEVLLKASSAMTDEPSNIVDKLECGVESVFDTLTGSVSSVVKKGTPELHKTTKWLRKGTGQVVRFGGSLVSKGVHFVSDNVMEKETSKEASNQHKELFQALKMYREALENKKITEIEVYM